MVVSHPPFHRVAAIVLVGLAALAVSTTSTLAPAAPPFSDADQLACKYQGEACKKKSQCCDGMVCYVDGNACNRCDSGGVACSGPAACHNDCCSHGGKKSDSGWVCK